MQGSEKKEGDGWTPASPVSIVCAFRLFAVLSSAVAAADNGEVAVREAQMARQAAEERTLELSAEVIRLEEQLETLQVAYSELFVETKELRDELALLRLQAETLVARQEYLDAAGMLSLAARQLAEVRAEYDGLYRQVRELGSYLDSTMEVLDADGTSPARALLSSRVNGILRDLERVEKLYLPAAAPRAVARRIEARVLAVNEELRLVVLDAGIAGGVIPGMLATIHGRGGVETEIRIVTVRQSISAAEVVRGKLQHIAPTATAVLIAKPN